MKFCDLACTCGRGVLVASMCCQRAVENVFASGDGRISRWSTVEQRLHRLWSVSVMTVREKCDEKSWGVKSPGSRPKNGRTWGTELSRTRKSGYHRLNGPSSHYLRWPPSCRKDIDS